MLGRLVEAEALDDRRFARRFAEDKRELRSWGPERIAEALRARGVEEAAIEGALADEGPDEVLGRATELLERSGAAVDDDASRARALALLARRGFDLEIAYEAVRARERG